MSETKLFSLIDDTAITHSKQISRNLRQSTKIGKDYKIEDDLNETVIKYLKNISYDKIDLNKFIKGLIAINEKKKFLWKSTDAALWVNSINPGNTYLPNVYHLLNTIFYNADSNERQKYFHELVNDYYRNLKKCLTHHGVNLEKVLSKSDFQEYIEQFLPCVKLDSLKFSLKNYNEHNEILAKNYIEELVEFIICPDLLREDCYKIIKKLHGDDCNSFNFELNPIEGLFGNLGHYRNLTIHLNYDGMSKDFNFFTKSPPTDNEYVRSVALLSFKKEEFFYNTFISKLLELGCDELTNFAPEVYFIRSNGIIVLEDLKKQGYAPLEIRDPNNYETFSLCLKKLAKLHASSIIFEEKMSKIMGKEFRIDKEYGQFLTETFIYKENDMMDCCGKYIYDFFPRQFPEILKDITLEEFYDKVSKMFNLIYEKVKRSTKFRNVICHGDPWVGNILHKESNSKKFAYLIDFQLIRYAPPLVDVLMFIYINTNKQFRDIYMKKLLSFYYKILTNYLREFNVDIKDIYDKNTFEECVEYFRDTGIVIGLHYTQIFILLADLNPYRTNDNDKKMKFVIGDRSEVYQAGLKNDDIFRNNVKGFIQDLCDYIRKNKVQ